MLVMPQDLWWKKIGAQPFSHAPYAYVRIDLVFQDDTWILLRLIQVSLK